MISILRYSLAILCLILLILIALLLLSSPTPVLRPGSTELGQRSFSETVRGIDTLINSSFFMLGLSRDDVRSVKTHQRFFAGQGYTFIEEEIVVPNRIGLEVVRDLILSKTRENFSQARVEVESEEADQLAIQISLEDAPILSLRFLAGGNLLASPDPAQRPKIALVVEGLGAELELTREVMGLDGPLTLAIVPGNRYSVQIATEGNELGHEVVLDLGEKTQQFSGVQPGPMAILPSMTEEEIRSRLRTQMKGIPYIKGVYSHLRPSFADDTVLMTVALEEIKAAGLYFFQGATGRTSLAYSLALDMGIKAGEKKIFLDNIKQRERVYEQLVRLSHQALKEGTAVGVIQPHPITMAVIKDNLPRLKRRGFLIVGLSEIVD
ncbi:MAG: divergent polysaccharide deacetylase family protein [Thermodesulfobacteriota bacterium]